MRSGTTPALFPDGNVEAEARTPSDGRIDADTAAQLIRKNAIDRYVVSVIPVILGEGIPLFSRGLPQQDLRLVSAAHSNGIAELTYEPR